MAAEAKYGEPEETTVQERLGYDASTPQQHRVVILRCLERVFEVLLALGLTDSPAFIRECRTLQRTKSIVALRPAVTLFCRFCNDQIVDKFTAELEWKDDRDDGVWTKRPVHIQPTRNALLRYAARNNKKQAGWEKRRLRKATITSADAERCMRAIHFLAQAGDALESLSREYPPAAFRTQCSAVLRKRAAAETAIGEDVGDRAKFLALQG